MIDQVKPGNRTLQFSEVAIVGVAWLALLAAQWALSTSIHGTNYYGWDGKAAQAIVRAAFRYARLFDVTYISPIQGVGSQAATMNVWANPSLWPFALISGEQATDVSALVALAIYAASAYVMLRCFDVPVVPSAIAAQLSILLFAPALLLILMPTNFCLVPADAVVYAPYMIALGVLARIEPGSCRRFAVMAGAIFGLVFYSIYADPMWAAVCGFCWAVPFAVVTLSPLRTRTVLLRVGALACCAVLLVLLGTAGYLETISQYTARVQFAAVFDRPRSLRYVSTLAWSSNMRIFYISCALGWLIGLLAVRGRVRVLVAAAAISFVAYVAYSAAFVLLGHTVWIPPIPYHLEHSLWELYIAGAVAGYWGLLPIAARLARRLIAQVRVRVSDVMASGRDTPPAPLLGIWAESPSRLRRAITTVIALVGVALVPAQAGDFALRKSSPYTQMFYQAWPNEPELMQFLSENLGAEPGQPMRGAIAFSEFLPATIFTPESAWALGIQTIDEHSQLVSPPALYFMYAMINQKGVLGNINNFYPSPGELWDAFDRAMQLLGMRYYLSSNGRAIGPEEAGYPSTIMPRRSLSQKPDVWHIYEYPHPNVGNYSPTKITIAQSAAEIIDKIKNPDFDFRSQVVLSEQIDSQLMPATDMRMARIRGGFHISGRSGGTSLVILPLQFSNCLRATDTRVRLVRADFLMAGMIFSNKVNTDITFDYGVFTPGCRRSDLAAFKQLHAKIDLRMPQLNSDRLFLSWDETVAKLREVEVMIGLSAP